MNPSISLHAASVSDLSQLLPLVRSYHEFEEISLSDAQRESAVSGLLVNPARGGIWLILRDETAVGYIAICTIYSIEFCGIDGVIDEFFIDEPFRGQGIGKIALSLLKGRVAAEGLRTLSLEVTHENVAARAFYIGLGFRPRDRYGLLLCELSAT